MELAGLQARQTQGTALGALVGPENRHLLAERYVDLAGCLSPGGTDNS